MKMKPSTLLVVIAFMAFLLTGSVFVANLQTSLDSRTEAAKNQNGANWESFAPTGIPNQNWNTAEALLSLLQSKGYQAIEIDQWKNGGWDGHVYKLPFNNFPITFGNAYNIKFAKGYDSKWRNLLNPTTRINNFTYAINPGWNLLGFSDRSLGKIDNAESLCIALNKLSKVDQVNQLSPRTQTELIWDEHICGQRQNNFSIDQGQGYFIKSQGSFNFLLPAK